MLEIIFAAFLLAMIAASVSSVLGYITRAEQRRAVRLQAYELANRLMLQYVDDEDALEKQRPSAGAFEFGGYVFRWRFDKVEVQLEEPANSVMQKPDRVQAQNFIKATLALRTQVYEAIPDGIGGYVDGELYAELRRIHTPLPLMSGNPDALSRLIKRPGALDAYARTLIGGDLGGGGQRPPGGTRPAPPRPRNPGRGGGG